MAERKDPPYFMYFPGNYRWSAAFINMLGSAPYGGSEIGELHKIGALLKGKAPEDDEAWFDACLKVADGVRGYADRFDKGGHRHAASHAFLRACNYYQMAERFRTPKDQKALSAFQKRDDVDDKKIGIVAISLGGYYSPRCAAMEPRYAACIAWGAQWDYHATWKKRIEASFKTSLSVPGHHINWILGVDTLDQALKKLEPFRLDGIVQKMRCPFLVVHGAEDEQVPLAHAQALHDASGSR